MIALALLLAQAATPSPVPVAPAGLSAEENFQKRCVFCHGADGQGHTKKGKQLKVPNFTKARWQTHTTDQEIAEAITDGIPKAKMPAFKDKLSAVEIQALLPYLRAFGKK